MPAMAEVGFNISRMPGPQRRKRRRIMQLTGAEIVIECLKEQGVDTVFGYPGGTILNIYDALYKHSDEMPDSLW